MKYINKYKLVTRPISINELVNAWPNIIIDERNLSARVWNFIKNIDDRTSSKYLIDKLKAIENPVANSKNNEKNLKIKLSSIMLLRYLKQIRENFSASPAGFQFECFMMGLLGITNYEPLERKPDSFDIKDKDGFTYQCKFIDNKGDIYLSDIVLKSCDFLIIGIKYKNEVDIYLLNNTNSKDFGISSIRSFIVKDGRKDKIYEKGYKKLDIPKLKKSLESNNRYHLDLRDDTINNRISELSKDLDMILSNIWIEFDGFRDDIEDVVTNMDQTNNKVMTFNRMHSRLNKFSKYILNLEDLLFNI